MEAGSSINLTASAILQNDSFITAFNLDLADSQRLISSGTQVKLEGLGGDILGSTTILGSTKYFNIIWCSINGWSF